MESVKLCKDHKTTKQKSFSLKMQEKREREKLFDLLNRNWI